MLGPHWLFITLFPLRVPGSSPPLRRTPALLIWGPLARFHFTFISPPSTARSEALSQGTATGISGGASLCPYQAAVTTQHGLEKEGRKREGDKHGHRPEEDSPTSLCSHSPDAPFPQLLSSPPHQVPGCSLLLPPLSPAPLPNAPPPQGTP